jgi:hypothetical protein
MQYLHCHKAGSRPLDEGAKRGHGHSVRICVTTNKICDADVDALRYVLSLVCAWSGLSWKIFAAARVENMQYRRANSVHNASERAELATLHDEARARESVSRSCARPTVSKDLDFLE